MSDAADFRDAVARLDELLRAVTLNALPQDKSYVSARTIASMLELSLDHTAKVIVQEPDFPRPVKIGRPRWRLDEVIKWIEDKRV